jgi:hypothetical protein
MRDWMEQENEQPEDKPKPRKRTGFRDLTAGIDNRVVRQAKKGKKGRRQQSQTIHLNESIADELKETVSRLAEQWGVPMNDVWQFALVEGLKVIEDGEAEPSFKKQKRKIVLPDL